MGEIVDLYLIFPEVVLLVSLFGVWHRRFGVFAVVDVSYCIALPISVGLDGPGMLEQLRGFSLVVLEKVVEEGAVLLYSDPGVGGEP